MDKKVFYLPNAGRRLLDVITEKGITITDLANATGLSRSTVYCFLYNGTDISSARLMKMCAYCGVSTDFILGLKENKDHRTGKKIKTAVYDGDKCLGVFPSLCQAARFVGVKTGVASRILNGMYKTTRGRFSFKEVKEAVV